MIEFTTFQLILVIILPYLLGSIPFSYIFAKALKGEDIRQKGSGNAGTANALRVYGWKIGLISLICDISKGLISAYIGLWIAGDIGLYIASVCAVVGHNYSIYLKFRGGKGIACATGVLLVIQPLPTVIIFAICILIVVKIKIVSVGSLIGLAASVISALILSKGNLWWISTVIIIAILATIAHRENIIRLIKGNERKLNF